MPGSTILDQNFKRRGIFWSWNRSRRRTGRNTGRWSWARRWRRTGRGIHDAFCVGDLKDTPLCVINQKNFIISICIVTRGSLLSGDIAIRNKYDKSAISADITSKRKEQRAGRRGELGDKRIWCRA